MRVVKGFRVNFQDIYKNKFTELWFLHVRTYLDTKEIIERNNKKFWSRVCGNALGTKSTHFEKNFQSA